MLNVLRPKNRELEYACANSAKVRKEFQEEAQKANGHVKKQVQKAKAKVNKS